MKALLFALTFSAPLTAAPINDRVEALKTEIIDIATTNQLRQDNFPQVRAQLQPLVDELIQLVPVRSEAEKKAEVVGAWQSLWSDMNFGPFLDYRNVYQAVYADGYYYNISRFTQGPRVATGFLRGEFVDAGDHFDIRFTRYISVGGWLGSGASLVDAGLAVENGQVTGADVPGPIGVRGTLQNTYVDQNLRIVIGKSTTDAQDSLFILKRVNAVP